jgi:hypothetical protein
MFPSARAPRSMWAAAPAGSRGGMLAVLGLAKPRSVADWGQWLLAGPPLNLAARLVVAAADRLNGGPDTGLKPVIRDSTMTMNDVRRESAELLPGRTVRPLLFWRYLLVYRADAMNVG